MAKTALKLITGLGVAVRSQWQYTPENYRDLIETGQRLYYSPDFYAEYNSMKDYYREYYYSESYGKDYYWKLYDKNRNIYSEESLNSRYAALKYYSNEGSINDSNFNSEVAVIAIVTTLALSLIIACLCRFYCVVRRLHMIEKQKKR